MSVFCRRVWSLTLGYASDYEFQLWLAFLFLLGLWQYIKGNLFDSGSSSLMYAQLVLNECSFVLVIVKSIKWVGAEIYSVTLHSFIVWGSLDRMYQYFSNLRLINAYLSQYGIWYYLRTCMEYHTPIVKPLLNF